MRREPKNAKVKFQLEEEQESAHPKLQIVDHNFKTKKSKYKNFDQINGTHPWQTHVPEGYIAYQARVVRKTKVAYFNFDLAREMGLIPKSHPNEIDKDLENKLIETFSLQIINEFDLENNKEYPKEDIKPNLYMATRYLQLQHPNKQGKTSGDGRSIWNGYVENKGQHWDVSSRGTGVTALSPGTVEAGTNLETGQENFGYGCGLCEIDELYATAIMSEIFHQKDIPTERTLLVLETGPGVGIGVRASQNLVRPAHLFAFLKQGNYDALKRATDYFINRQKQNLKLGLEPGFKSSYKKLLNHITEQYAKFAARLESDYIFAWFDWDGDNMLMDIGILDYGSIRQFGTRHDEYRYDDVTRYSTNLNEQKDKTRKIIQAFCQMTDFLLTGEKKSLSYFSKHKNLKHFDQVFKSELVSLFGEKLGLSRETMNAFNSVEKNSLKKLFSEYTELEKLKSQAKATPVDDGINREPLLNGRKLLEVSPLLLTEDYCDTTEFYSKILTESCTQTHSKPKASVLEKIENYYVAYINLMKPIFTNTASIKKLEKISFTQNHPERITGNSITYIVYELMNLRDKDLKGQGLQRFIDMFIYNQVKKTKPSIKAPKYNRVPTKVLREAMYIVREHNEEI